MSWQEELRKLDEELASGRLSADDYRVRRDQVLSSAVAPGDPQPQQQQQPPQQPGGMFTPQQPTRQPPWQQQQQPPQQPTGDPNATQVVGPVSPPAGTPQQSNAEATQIVGPADLSSDRTQAVPHWQAQAPQQPQYAPPQQPGFPASPAGGFQQPASPAGGFQQPQQPQHPQQQPGWNTPDDVNPPWGGSDFPPISPASESEWTRQGPEAFDDSGKGKGGKIAIIAVVAVLVLGGLVTGGIFLFGGGGGEENPPTTQAQSPPPPPPAPPKPTGPGPNSPLIERIPAPPGQADAKSGKLDLNQLTTLGIMDQTSVDALKGNGATEAAWRGSVKGADANSPHPDKFSVTAVKFADATKARAAATALTKHQDELGWILDKTQFPGIPTSVVFHKEVNQKKVGYHGVWVSGNTLVQVSVSLDPIPEPAKEAEAAMSGSYQRQTVATLKNFPAS
ncbi:flagellar basal body-associated protein FliL [Amycolatopsis suaedae]|uniref:Flagellar basal body-associated protein FliL n=1 Tax=Amycolatopsis suaedae TaxID=2510978 RepID=A0A4Q7J5Y2_9PSEU|nr:flagellar basal body-associated protein FliL [Amycolatopsis suaedae]RZQ62142.1 flagellar basal body-associated protein FliL [Amycolatopsis suaedae]